MSNSTVPLYAASDLTQESRIGIGETKRLAALLRMPGQPLPQLSTMGLQSLPRTAAMQLQPRRASNSQGS